ncbi:MAG: hypothetical protein AAF441_11645 [Pseudomonadota bacterium]
MLSLPGILGEIAEVAGLKAALQVARARGGTKAYFGERFARDGWLVEAVGQEAALIIGRHFATGHGGMELDVPMGPAAERTRIWREIRYRHADGQTRSQIALALGISGRSVQYHLNGHRPLADADFELATSDPAGYGAGTAGTSAELAAAAADNATAMAALVAENQALRQEVQRLNQIVGATRTAPIQEAA